jgi:hypothetical protein
MPGKISNHKLSGESSSAKDEDVDSHGYLRKKDDVGLPFKTWEFYFPVIFTRKFGSELLPGIT